MQDALNWLYEIIGAFAAWLLGLLSTVIDWIKDLVLDLFQALLDGVYSVVSAIPVPEFMQGNLGEMLGGMPQLAVFYAVQLRIPEAVMMFGAAYTFRLIRKVVTLGQW